MVLVGLSKVDQTEVVRFLRTRLPVLSRVAEETPRLEVLDCQTTAPEPLRRRRLPDARNSKVAPESTDLSSPPATQMGKEL